MPFRKLFQRKLLFGAFVKARGGGSSPCQSEMNLLESLMYQYKSYSKCRELIPSDPGVTRNVNYHKYRSHLAFEIL